MKWNTWTRFFSFDFCCEKFGKYGHRLSATSINKYSGQNIKQHKVLSWQYAIPIEHVAKELTPSSSECTYKCVGGKVRVYCVGGSKNAEERVWGKWGQFVRRKWRHGRRSAWWRPSTRSEKWGRAGSGSCSTKSPGTSGTDHFRIFRRFWFKYW